MSGQPSWDIVHALVVERWGEYVAPRRSEWAKQKPARVGIAPHRVRQSAGWAEDAWQRFQERSMRLYETEERAARRAGERLDFKPGHLQLLLLEGLVRGCALCGMVYGVEQAAIAWEEHPTRFGAQLYRLRNLVPACARCAQAIDLLTAAAWRDVLMALKAEPDWVAARFLAKAGGVRGSSPPPPPASNARAAALAQAPRGKKGLSTR